MNGEQPKNGRFDWRTIGVTVGLVLAGQLVQWGIMSATMADHSRRLDLIEKREQEQYVTRPEYERRDEDLRQRTEENRERIQKIEQEKLEELQKRPAR